MARLTLFVKPGSKAAGLERLDDGRYVLRVRERAVDGAANAACRRDLAELLKLRASQVSLVHGTSSRTKIFEFDAIDDEALHERLARALGD